MINNKLSKYQAEKFYVCNRCLPKIGSADNVKLEKFSLLIFGSFLNKGGKKNIVMEICPINIFNNATSNI